MLQKQNILILGAYNPFDIILYYIITNNFQQIHQKIYQHHKHLFISNIHKKYISYIGTDKVSFYAPKETLGGI